MKEVKAIIRPFRLPAVLEGLQKLDRLPISNVTLKHE